MNNAYQSSHSTYAHNSALSQNWGQAIEFAFCQQCHWHYLLPQGIRLPNCPHCYQRTIIPFQPRQISLSQPPELFLSFSVPPETLTERIQSFAQSIPFAPSDLQPSHLQARLQQVYLPLWLVDTHLQATFRGEVGFDYDVASHQERYAGENWKTEQVTETRIRWETRVGRLNRNFYNIPAPALEESDHFKQFIASYELSACQPYTPQAITDSLVRLPTRSPADAWPAALPSIQKIAAKECQQAASAQHIREFAWNFTPHNQNWTLYLVPLYTTYYLDDDQQTQLVLLQGQSGQLSGKRRASMTRAKRLSLSMIGIALTIALISLLAITLTTSSTIAPFVGILLAMILGLLAFYPVIKVWQFNRAE